MSKPAYRRTQPIAAYLLLLMLCIGAYFLYTGTVVPLIEPATIARQTTVSTDSYQTIESDIEHHVWFADNDWERRPCAVLLTSHGKILFDDCEAIDPKTWVVKPFSIIMHRDTDPSIPIEQQPPIILRCQKGATLKLDQPVSAFSKSNFQLKTADLVGEVQLYRRKPDSSGDELRIETSNVKIDGQSVTTIDDVAFWFGDNHGIGRQLSLSLSHEGRTGSNKFSAINGITDLRMGLLSTMRLNPTQKPPTKSSSRMLSTDNSPIQINTQGPFEFDFKTNIARFRNQIKIQKLDGNNDQLDCDELLLKFKSEQGKQMVELDATANNEYELQSIVAKGTPVILNAPSQNANIRAQILKYDLLAQVVQASDDAGVTIVRADTQFFAKSMQYQLTEDGRLGQLSAIGPGQLVKQDPTDPLQVRWDKTLTIKRRNKDKHLIQLIGNVALNMGDDTQLNANRLNLNIWEVPVTDSSGKITSWTYQPADLKAKNQVHIESEKLTADTTELVATWPANPTAPRPVIQPAIQPAASRIRTSTELQQFPRQPSHNSRYNNFVKRANYQDIPVAPESKLVATGELIEVVVTSENDKSKISDLTITGNVTVQKPSKINTAMAEFTVTGDQLHLTPQDDKNYHVHVSAQQRLASILSDRFRVDGREVFLDQAGNQMWIKGQGQVILDSMNQDAPATQQPNEMKISFAGGMIFNGQNIYFEYGIDAFITQLEADGSTTQTRATGNALKITLDQKIDFDNMDTPHNKAKPQITELIFRSAPPAGQAQFKLAGFDQTAREPVSINSEKRDRSGKLIEKFKLNSPHATMNQQRDQLTALGPGAIEIYRRGQAGKKSGLGFVGNSADSSNPNAITYIHTLFTKQLNAGLKSKDLLITGNIRSIYVPVQGFSETYDPIQPQATPEGTVQLYCNRVELTQSNNPLSPKPRNLFVASGNAQIAADHFACRGDEINYRDDNNELVVESKTSKNVILKLRNSPQSAFDKDMTGSRFTYNVQTKTAVANDVESLSAPFNKKPSP